MPEDSSGKTEQPTPHKLGEARKKGQIAKSKELTSALLFITSFVVLNISSVYIWDSLVTLMHYSFGQIPSEFSYGISGIYLNAALKTAFMVLLPMFITNFLLVFISESMQTQFLFTFTTLTPDINRINPFEQAKKYFTLKHYMTALKSVLKIVIVFSIVFFALKDKFPLVLKSQYLSLWQLIHLRGSLVMDIVIKVGIFFIFISVLDYFYERYEFVKSMMMTKKEIKEEYKRLEGDPEIKKRQREKQRKMAQSRQMGAVPGADVVVTNPVHVAVAIQYKPEIAKAPIILAKGRKLLAQEIKRVADENYVPIIENQMLARALYKYGDVGVTIPPQFYRAVAEILAFVYNLKKKRNLR